MFFGRDAERKRIIGNLRASRLTLLYAESGVGKSSLLRAGVSARLRQLAARSVAERGSARYVPVVFSAWQGRLEGRPDRRARGRRAAAAARRCAARAPTRRARRRHRGRRRRRWTRRRSSSSTSSRSTSSTSADDGRLRRRARATASTRARPAGELPDLRPRGRLFADRPSLQGPHPQRLRQLPASRLPRRDGPPARRSLNPSTRSTSSSRPALRRFEVEPALVDAVLEQVRRGRVAIGDGGAARRRRHRPRARGDRLPAARHEAPLGRGDHSRIATAAAGDAASSGRRGHDRPRPPRRRHGQATRRPARRRGRRRSASS